MPVQIVWVKNIQINYYLSTLLYSQYLYVAINLPENAQTNNHYFKNNLYIFSYIFIYIVIINME